MPRHLLIDYLEGQRARFTRKSHEAWYKTPGSSSRLPSHFDSHSFARVVMIKVDGEMAMMVLPCAYQVDTDVLRQALRVKSVEIAREREYRYRFPRCEPGAMPPFGHLFGFLTYIVPVFEAGQEIAFYGGTHDDIIYMQLEEYLRLAHVIEVTDGVVPAPASVITESQLPALHF